MTAQYSHEQIIFALNSIANLPSNRHGSTTELENYAKTMITRILSDSATIDLIGEWELVWGPVVYQTAKSSVADNAMYVAQSKTTPTDYVVAISGTNPISWFGWFVEDFTINPTEPWPYGSASPQVKGKISQGTLIGMRILMDSLQDTGANLSTYLSRQVSSQSSPLSITVTGHSLGGALSPALALALLDTQNDWDSQKSASISVLPSAGPTPGNDTWRDYYDHSIGSSTTRLWNAIDMVPHAWQLSMLKEIPDLYEPTLPASGLIKALVDIAEVNSIVAGNMQQICPTTPGLPGTVDNSISIDNKDLIIILETLLANQLIERMLKALKLPPMLIPLVKKIIDDYIKHLNNKSNGQTSLAERILSKAKSEDVEKLRATSDEICDWIDDLVNFLKQAGYQHTTAYSILIGTTAFEKIVATITTEN